MSDFTASNGIPVSITGDGWLMTSNADHTNPAVVAAGEHVEAIAELFRAREDERLRRWRWPENPDFVVKRDPRGERLAHVLHEPSLATAVVGPVAPYGIGSDRDRLFTRAARAFFAAHPEPKPWHDAECGEVWVLTMDGEDYAATREYGPDFKLSNSNRIEPRDERITAGRRIWPEVAS